MSWYGFSEKIDSRGGGRLFRTGEYLEMNEGVWSHMCIEIHHRNEVLYYEEGQPEKLYV